MTGPYELLPAVHRLRDAERGYPLRSLLDVVAQEWSRLRDDVDDLYDTWFIETCDEWAVPYIGDLLGVTGLAEVGGGAATRRALVANTIGYRRRKGTAAMLEQLARDVTGWPARAVEYFQHLDTSQHLHHVRTGNVRTPDLRGAGRLELLGTPFDTVARTGEARHIDVRRGRYNIDNVGLHLWRLAAYASEALDARAVDVSLGRWVFDPAGRDLPLFNRPRTENEATHLATETDVPAPVRRRALHAELHGGPPLYLAAPPAFSIRLPGEPVPVPAARLECCDLTDWRRPDPPAPGTPPNVAVDPLLGRFTLPDGTEPARVGVDVAHGFSGDVGAGPYDHRAVLADALAVGGLPWPERVQWQIGVSRDIPAVPDVVVGSMTEAVDAWNARPAPRPGDAGVIAVMDSATYTGDLTVVVPAGTRLLLVAAAWPDRADPDHPGVRIRDRGTFVATGLRPHLIGSIEVTGEPGAASADSELVVGGLSIEGHLGVTPGELGGLVVANCTLSTDRAADLADGGVISAQNNPHLTVRMLRSICTAVRLSAVPGLGLTDSIVHAGGDTDAEAVDAATAHVEIEACTILGRTTTRSLAASNAILRGRVTADRRQQGCVRFSYVAPGSRTPRRFHCLPDESGPVAPRFTSVEPGRPGFAQLGRDCPEPVVVGADDEGEMGVFHFLQQHRRLANLKSQLSQYLRFGLEAGIFLET